jgi:hypothetical protein
MMNESIRSINQHVGIAAIIVGSIDLGVTLPSMPLKNISLMQAH